MTSYSYPYHLVTFHSPVRTERYVGPAGVSGVVSSFDAHELIDSNAANAAARMIKYFFHDAFYFS